MKSHFKGVCKKCGNVVNYYSFNYFIDKNMNLDSIFKPCYFEKVLKFDFSNKSAIKDCQKCDGKVQIDETTKIVKLPEILIFTLERNLNGTNDIKVRPNEILDFRRYVDENLNTYPKYILFAKTIRLGSTKKYEHEIYQIKINDIWYEFNESTITPKKNDYDDCIYGLFYKKKQ